MQPSRQNSGVLQALSLQTFSKWIPLSCGNTVPIVLVLLLVFITLPGEMLLPRRRCPERAKWRSALQMNLHAWLSEWVMDKERPVFIFSVSENLCLDFPFSDSSPSLPSLIRLLALMSKVSSRTLPVSLARISYPHPNDFNLIAGFVYTVYSAVN